MQYHDGPHNYSEEGLISYEDQMVQKMSEIEQAVLEKSRPSRRVHWANKGRQGTSMPVCKGRIGTVPG